MKQHLYLLAPILLLISRVDAGCEQNEPESYNWYRCTGGTIADLEQIPDNASWIDIENMPVGCITETLLSRFADHLQMLHFWECQLTDEDIDDNVFHGLKELHELSLARNNLTTVKAVWFKSLPSLKHLSLQNNEIDDIEDKSFSGLYSIYLHGNNLTKVRSKWFEQPENMRFIMLDSNRIDTIDDNTFSKFTDLRVLSLEHNKLKNVKAKWFGNTVANLEKLELGNNTIEEFDDELLKKAVKLNDLFLQDNKLNCTSIKKIISGLPELWRLVISGNSHSECHEELEELGHTRNITLYL